jgi:LmbE family N-acetylglucosaminyl deacetylase
MTHDPAADPRFPQRFTLVSFHAHPDDEALYTGATLARAATEGHRVVVVVATDGDLGLAPVSYGRGEVLASRRAAELEESTRLLGVARLVRLGYADSGFTLRRGAGSFASLDVEEPAQRLAEVLREEHADAMTIYDANGGYGHPDHRQVHRVGTRAAELAGTPVVLEATVDRDLLRSFVPLLRLMVKLNRRWYVPPLDDVYTPRSRLTHRIDVAAYADLKRAALVAHASQSSGDGDTRTIGLILRLPRWLFRRVFRHEWFTEHGRRPGPPLCGDLFDTLRSRS